MKPCETHGRPDDDKIEKMTNRNECLHSTDTDIWMKARNQSGTVLANNMCSEEITNYKLLNKR
jgi:hypothetical protein